MKSKDERPEQAAELRKRAEEIFQEKAAQSPEDLAASAMGIRAFLYKPLVMRGIAGAVRKALDNKNA